jgi:membrane protease YdiL (CAAX protease family)
MKPILLTLLLDALIIFLVLLLIQRKRVFDHIQLLTLFFGAFSLDNLAITLTNRYPGLQILPNHIWEGFLVCIWSGKLYSILLILLLIFVCRSVLSKEAVGLTLRQNEGSLLPAILVVTSLAAWALVVGFGSQKGQCDLETLFYLAIMPGLNEELVYRGYLLAVLNQVLPGRFTLLKARIGWGVLATSFLFGLLHGLWLDNDLVLHVDGIALRNTILSGLIFAWLRERTGSLLVPVAAHGIEDVFFFLPRMI